MTNDTIEKIIDALNYKQSNELIFMSDISNNVVLAKVWIHEPKGNIGNEGSYTFYFIKDDNGIYIGAVLDMSSDLHIFIKKEYRKKGYLSRAMNQIILPHLFHNGRKHQKITYRDPFIGDYVKRNWGFEIIDSHTASKDLSYYKDIEISQKTRAITQDELNSIKNKIDKARLYLTMAGEQVESICGHGNDANLKDLAHELFWLDDKVFDYIQNLQRN